MRDLMGRVRVQDDRMARWSATGIGTRNHNAHMFCAICPNGASLLPDFQTLGSDIEQKVTSIPVAIPSGGAIALAVPARPTRMRSSRRRDGAARLAIERKAPGECC
jgi:hypothetical protein